MHLVLYQIRSRTIIRLAGPPAGTLEMVQSHPPLPDCEIMSNRSSVIARAIFFVRIADPFPSTPPVAITAAGFGIRPGRDNAEFEARKHDLFQTKFRDRARQMAGDGLVMGALGRNGSILSRCRC